MLFLKYLLIFLGVGLAGGVATIVAYDIYLATQLRRLLGRLATDESGASLPASRRPLPLIRRHPAQQLALLAILPLLLGLSIVVVSDGSAGIRFSQISSVGPGTLYLGVHPVMPLVDRIELCDTRERV